MNARRCAAPPAHGSPTRLAQRHARRRNVRRQRLFSRAAPDELRDIRTSARASDRAMGEIFSSKFHVRVRSGSSGAPRLSSATLRSIVAPSSRARVDSHPRLRRRSGRQLLDVGRHHRRYVHGHGPGARRNPDGDDLQHRRQRQRDHRRRRVGGRLRDDHAADRRDVGIIGPSPPAFSLGRRSSSSVIQSLSIGNQNSQLILKLFQ